MTTVDVKYPTTPHKCETRRTGTTLNDDSIKQHNTHIQAPAQVSARLAMQRRGSAKCAEACRGTKESDEREKIMGLLEMMRRMKKTIKTTRCNVRKKMGKAMNVTVFDKWKMQC